MSIIVQYVLVRGDLIKTLNWPVGAVVAQACHACTAVIHMFYNDSNTQSYLEDLDSMHKIVLEGHRPLCQHIQKLRSLSYVDKGGSFLCPISCDYFNLQWTYQVPDEDSLKKLSETLGTNAISHKLWIEQPENCATCLAVKPYPKEEIQKYFKKFKLLNSYSDFILFPKTWLFFT